MDSTVEHSSTSHTRPFDATLGPAPFFGAPNWVSVFGMPSLLIGSARAMGERNRRQLGFARGGWQGAPASRDSTRGPLAVSRRAGRTHDHGPHRATGPGPRRVVPRPRREHARPPAGITPDRLRDRP